MFADKSTSEARYKTTPNASIAKPLARPDFDAVVVGAGFAGIYILHRLKSLGMRVRLYEAAPEAGGTWYWNRYPGATSDIESLEYSYSFSEELQQQWTWSRRFGSQKEILAYMNHVIDRFELRGLMQFNTKVDGANFDESNDLWKVRLADGKEVVTRHFIVAVGYMSTPKPDEIPGIEDFKGELYRTYDWPDKEVTFSGKRVGVIGTGPSGMQCVPVIAEEADRLFVFQRTPNFSVAVRNGPMDPGYQEQVKSGYYAVRRKERNSQCGIDLWMDPLTIPTKAVTDDEIENEFEKRWEAGGLYFLTSYTDLLTDPEANAKAAEFVRKKIRAAVKDPVVAEKLVPKGYAFGSRRVCTNTGYYEAFNRPNVELVDIKSDPITRVDAEGVRTGSRFYGLDMLVLALGFDALTGTISRLDILGRRGVSLNERWKDGPVTNFGLMTKGFPNLYMIDIAHHPFTSYNTVPGIEFQGEWVADVIEFMRRNTLKTIETTAEAEEAYTKHLQEVASKTVIADGENWYNGANVKGKKRVIRSYYGGFQTYKKQILDSVSKNYEGFVFEEF
jgi:cyclohexanone monooxygenase